MTAHVKVRMVSLTGSIATGAHIIGHTASSIKRTHMELGGKAPVIVFDDADIDAVVDGVRTFGFYNAGQDCTAAAGSTPSRVSMTSWWRNLGRRWPA
ncbi:4-aminobutyraldehyde dehydrogenase [Klebsiella pneumoniae]|uniref:4-aminobutyraldehyde dehydrogenase n=1 Tax=Klebsiella pneumoniae TaxID=573 RepID=A0A2X1RJN4_KLEPN|nr:4-aminobutyraldehyde dehydrogenase [Klebsiella pneumoniae]